MKLGLKVILFLGIIAVCFIASWFFFYEGLYAPSPVGKPSYEDITVAPTPGPGKFTDVYQPGEGIVVVDLAHDNNFSLAELNPLRLRIISRGYHIEYVQKEEAEKSVSETLEKKLRAADVLVVLSPVASYSGDEVRLVREFVDKGGRLLLIADPTRPGNMNSLSSEFGLVFESGYLYNLEQNDGNFRNIFINKFETNDLTEGLTRIVLYTAGYISPATNGLAFTDDNTFASITQAKGRFSPVALGSNSKVLAISDLSFMTEPHNTVCDNNQFVSNIADWLAESERIFSLSDFPHCLGDDVTIAYTDSSVLDVATRLKALLADVGKEAEIGQREASLTLSQDTIFIGLFDETEAVRSYLDAANISITTEEEPITVEIGTMGNVYRKGTSLIDLSGGVGQRLLLILADTEDMLRETVDLLEGGQFRQWLATDRLAIYRAKGVERAEPANKEK